MFWEWKEIIDEYGNFLESKIDVGVHKELDISTEEALLKDIEFVKSLQ